MLITFNDGRHFTPVEMLGEQFSLITQPPHLDRARSNTELVDGAMNILETSSEKSRRCSGFPVEKYRVNPRCHGVVSGSVNLHAYVRIAGSIRGPIFVGGTQ